MRNSVLIATGLAAGVAVGLSYQNSHTDILFVLLAVAVAGCVLILTGHL